MWLDLLVPAIVGIALLLVGLVGGVRRRPPSLAAVRLVAVGFTLATIGPTLVAAVRMSLAGQWVLATALVAAGSFPGVAMLRAARVARVVPGTGTEPPTVEFSVDWSLVWLGRVVLGLAIALAGIFLAIHEGSFIYLLLSLVGAIWLLPAAAAWDASRAERRGR